MQSATFNNVKEVLSRTVKPDGRLGGLQKYVNEKVDVLTYLNTEEEEGN